MPIYEYRRPDGSTFEVLQSFSDEPLSHDPETGVEVQRVLHAPAVHFKGSGFYNTDYGTRRRQRENAASGESSTTGEGTGATGEGGKDDKGTAEPKASSESKAAKGETKAQPKAKSEPVGAK
jgi:putative FmdB family regulatory protein